MWPKGRPTESMAHGVPITYVPARNTILLALLLGYAEVVGAFDLFIGAWIMSVGQRLELAWWRVVPVLPLTFMFGPAGLLLFAIFFVVGLCVYFYLVVDRRISQKQFILENQLAATSLSPVLMPEIEIFDNKNNISSLLSSPNSE